MVTPFQANIPVVIEGVGIYPGQYIFCDSSGAVVIPDSDIDDVLETAHRVRADDAASRDLIAREARSGDLAHER